MRFETERKIEMLEARYRGLRDGVAMFAHWKDGVQYVGTCGKTLVEAIKELNKEEEIRLRQLYDRG